MGRGEIKKRGTYANEDERGSHGGWHLSKVGHMWGV